MTKKVNSTENYVDFVNFAVADENAADKERALEYAPILKAEATSVISAVKAQLLKAEIEVTKSEKQLKLAKGTVTDDYSHWDKQVSSAKLALKSDTMKVTDLKHTLKHHEENLKVFK
ncbi:MAG: hypothetical protein GY775_16870 [Candidatus Scalindua sp.]|nr:hypothetical protein [Candidatus Scalindua sp.]